ncbi:MAG TPA: serine hydrolase domain-containing protein [Chloroflexota bacterium]|nr:serine hydrolase domain-containing protein [Chloroflexota bacterium]
MTASLVRHGTGSVSARNLAYLDEHVQRYVSSGRLAGALTVVFHRGEVVHWSAQGLRDRERGTLVTDDTIWRIYSMTKPIVSVALMQLYERGLVQLDDPVHRYIPSWTQLGVYASGSYPEFQTAPCERPMTVRDLLSHQSGLTYGNVGRTAVDAAYRQLGIGRAENRTLQDMIDRLAELPLEFSPGTAWNYSVSTDVVGYLVQVISGQRLDRYLQEQIFEPLGMTDTAFWVRPDQVDRLATNYRPASSGGIEVFDDAATSTYLKEPTFHSGGGGLVSTAGDYLRFCRMLLGTGTLDGARIIGRKTLELMTKNHLPGNRPISDVIHSGEYRASYAGNGFGLGFAVSLDTADGQVSTTPGEYYWSGAANTQFWIDPVEDLAVVFMSQYMASSPATRYNVARELRAIVYGALE